MDNMMKKHIYIAPDTNIVRLSLSRSVAVPKNDDRTDDPGTQLTVSFDTNQGAKGYNYDDNQEMDPFDIDWDFSWEEKQEE